jgi:hypothetical protein
MIKLALSQIEKNKSNRPEGYYEDVVSSGKVDGEYLLIENDAFVALANKYRPKVEPPKPIENLAKSMKNWAKAGFKTVNKAEYEKRLKICRSCEFWNEQANYSLGRCEKCKCTKMKLKLATESCPIGKW